jgi:nucleoside-diphosphate-sugar epimerase
MKIIIIGGSGLIGSKIVSKLPDQGQTRRSRLHFVVLQSVEVEHSPRRGGIGGRH